MLEILHSYQYLSRNNHAERFCVYRQLRVQKNNLEYSPMNYRYLQFVLIQLGYSKIVYIVMYSYPFSVFLLFPA